MPSPQPGESQKNFISRCIPIVIKEGTAKDEKQAYAICNSMFTKKMSYPGGTKNNEEENKSAIKDSGVTLDNTARLPQDWIDGVTLAEEAEPKDAIMLFPFGEFEHPSYGKLKFNNTFFNDIIENYNKKVLATTPFMDKEHAMGEALAWFNEPPFIRQGIGLFARPTYTTVGEKLLKEKIYKYFSPWFEDFKDAQTGIEHKNVWRGGAATNIPFLKIMPPIIDDIKLEQGNNSVSIKLSELKYTLSQTESNEEGVNTDELNAQKSGNDSGDNIRRAEMVKLKKIFGLAETATDEELEAKVQSLLEENKSLANKMKKLEEKNEDVKENPEVKELQEKLSDVTKKLTEQKMDKVLIKALSEGKIIPADKEKWQKKFLADPEGTEDTLGLLRPSIKLGEIGSTGEGENMSENKLLDEAKKIYQKEKSEGNKSVTLSECIIKARQENPELGREYERDFLPSDARRSYKF